MTIELRRLLWAWLALLALLAVEYATSFLTLGQAMRPLIMLPAVVMAAVVGSVFMRVEHGPTIVRLFAGAALLWLTVLLLGSLDPLTRTDYPVGSVRVE